MKYVHLFAFNYLTFYEPDDENVFNLFRGFYWNEVEEVNEEIIGKLCDL